MPSTCHIKSRPGGTKEDLGIDLVPVVHDEVPRAARAPLLSVPQQAVVLPTRALVYEVDLVGEHGVVSVNAAEGCAAQQHAAEALGALGDSPVNLPAPLSQVDAPAIQHAILCTSRADVKFGFQNALGCLCADAMEEPPAIGVLIQADAKESKCAADIGSASETTLRPSFFEAATCSLIA
eukprot:CAMPEP_0183538156 /NCGR_PEP_ID=MMETSP0371-20130417/29394_1 /TAXON_ID=268820 /ORGANISM="Peridinium aciculiferum, Strain PAER-2" /LENGTH=179 /DNA_ID=CAMNT_0025738953 /DNA_START=110 /DNA_END=648 /DNA_ORIENTATION=+